jgi:hypothetical protein
MGNGEGDDEDSTPSRSFDNDSSFSSSSNIDATGCGCGDNGTGSDVSSDLTDNDFEDECNQHDRELSEFLWNAFAGEEENVDVGAARHPKAIHQYGTASCDPVAELFDPNLELDALCV